MTVRSLVPKAALAVAVVAAAGAFSAPAVRAALAPGDTTLATTKVSQVVTPTPKAPRFVDLTFMPEQGKTYTVTVNVPVAGEYQVNYFVNYPNTSGLMRTFVDGKKLADVVSPAVPGTYGTIAKSECIQLTAGQHTFRLTGVKFPTGIGAQAYLASVN
jgi:hypothetical protein